jgi:hypothetical protein
MVIHDPSRTQCKRIDKLFFLSPEKGAETSIFLASSPSVEGVTGKYFIKQLEVASSPESYNQEITRSLWEVSVKLTGLEDNNQ